MKYRLIICEKHFSMKKFSRLSSAEVVIGTLRDNTGQTGAGSTTLLSVDPKEAVFIKVRNAVKNPVNLFGLFNRISYIPVNTSSCGRSTSRVSMMMLYLVIVNRYTTRARLFKTNDVVS